MLEFESTWTFQLQFDPSQIRFKYVRNETPFEFNPSNSEYSRVFLYVIQIWVEFEFFFNIHNQI